MLRQDAVNKLDKAQKEDLEVLQDWLRREEGGNNFLQSFEDRPWGDDADDLVAVGGGIGADVDMVTKWTASTAIPWLNRHGLYRLKVSLKVTAVKKHWLCICCWQNIDSVSNRKPPLATMMSA